MTSITANDGFQPFHKNQGPGSTLPLQTVRSSWGRNVPSLGSGADDEPRASPCRSCIAAIEGKCSSPPVRCPQFLANQQTDLVATETVMFVTA